MPPVLATKKISRVLASEGATAVSSRYFCATKTATTSETVHPEWTSFLFEWVTDTAQGILRSGDSCVLSEESFAQITPAWNQVTLGSTRPRYSIAIMVPRTGWKSTHTGVFFECFSADRSWRGNTNDTDVALLHEAWATLGFVGFARFLIHVADQHFDFHFFNCGVNVQDALKSRAHDGLEVNEGELCVQYIRHRARLDGTQYVTGTDSIFFNTLQFDLDIIPRLCLQNRNCK